MLPAITFQTVSILADLLILIFIAYYLLKLSDKEKQLETKEKILEKKEGKMDADYHEIVDDALTKERKIVDDAAHEADQIITGAHYINKAAKESVAQAIRTMLEEIQKEAHNTSEKCTQNYQTSLNLITTQSLTDFQNVIKQLYDNLQKQIKDVQDSMLPALQKELAEYKEMRMKQTDQDVISIVQKATQEIFNKSISFNDHENLLIESLEKAKKESLFD